MSGCGLTWQPEGVAWSQPPAPGGPYTDAQAVAAVSTWREYHDTGRSDPASATGTFASYLVLTTSPLVGGIYRFSISTVAGGALVGSGTEIEVQLVIDSGALVLIGPYADYGVSQGRYAFGGVFALPFAPGVHTLDLQFRQPSSPGTTQILGANWVLERVA